MNRIDKVGWYLRRLRSMSPTEVGYRLRQWTRLEADRRRLLRPFPSNSPGTGVEGWTTFRQEQGASFFFCERERNTLVQHITADFPDEEAATWRTAQELLAHRFMLFGRPAYLSTPIPWQCDPFTGREWPERFWGDIDTRDAKTAGGVKWVWELNRHHHLVTLGKAYFLSGEDCYAEEVCVQLTDWIEANPVGIGVNWTSPLEMALRIINWSWALAFVRGSPALTCPRFESILHSISAQAQHIARYLSAHSSANNHLVGEAVGLVVAGICFPWLADAESWRDQGVIVLTQEIERQIHADGVPAEQATHYLAFILDFYWLAWRLLDQNGHVVPSIWQKRLGAACDYLRHVMDPNGHVPPFGDSDDAWVVRLDDRAKANNVRSILATAAVLLRRPEFKAAAGRWDEKSHWLLSHEGRDVFRSLPDGVPAVESCAFAQGGYCVMRRADRIAVFDCGPLGYLSTAAHGHADALGLTASVGGRPILIDPGTYAYHEGDAWRDYFRGTSAHNTVVVDGQNQSEIQGTFLWGRKANTQLLGWDSTPDYDIAVAEHDGYAGRGVVHRRTVIFDKPDWLLVVDRLLGTATHTFEQLWHFPAESTIEQVGDAHYVHVQDKRFAVLQLEMPEIEVTIYHGVESPIQGWVSERYGHRVPAPVLGFCGDTGLPMTLITAISLGSHSTNLDVENVRRTLRTRVAVLERQVSL